MLLTAIIQAIALVGYAGASPTRSATVFTVKESVPAPRKWTQTCHAPADHKIQLKIALPQPNFHVLEQHLYEVSDPGHARYGAHLSKEEVEAIVTPHPDSIQLVDEWLLSHGLHPSNFLRSPANDWITVEVPVSTAELMLNTTYHVWTHDETGEAIVRTTEYSVPDFVHDHVELIQPTTMFSRTRQQKTTFRWSQVQSVQDEVATGSITLPNGVTVDASCNTTITVTCLKQLYNAVGFTPSAKNNEIGITGYLGQFANIADLQTFFADQVPAAVNSSFDFVSVNGGLNSQNISQAGAEANLDTQFAYGISFPAKQTFWSTAGQPPFIPDIGTPTDSNEPYTTWLDFILAQKDIPQTISTSYGDDEQTVPVNFARRVCAGFAQLGVRGVSLMFSSGDGGVGDGDPDPATQECFTNDGRNATQFIPGFPASCPFVTAVGGVTHIPEVAISFSGGGFSNTFQRPFYQDVAVSRFLDKLPKGTYAGLFNPGGRAIPDVSAQSNLFRIFFRGRAASIGGTSASSPAFAGIVSLLNDARLSKGLPPLGFLNPLLYTVGASGFNDITAGNNPGCGTPGFNATTGWDPVTGLGTPDFGKLLRLIG